MVALDDLKMMRALQGVKSLAAAARVLDLTPPALTMRLKRLEAELQRVLVVRGPRGISLTDDGALLAAESVELVDRLEGIPAMLGVAGHAVTGSLRVVAPFGFGRAYMAQIVADFRAAHPALRVNLHLSESPMAEVANSDVVIHIGALKDSGWVQYRLAPNRRVLCASPGFASRLRAKPVQPTDLLDLPCLTLKENDEDVVRWRMNPVKAADAARAPAEVIRVSGPLSSNDGGVVTRWALAGLGVMVRSEWEVAPLIRDGRLVRLMEDWEFDDAPVLALTPVRARTSARLQRFIESCRDYLDPAPWRRGGEKLVPR